MLQTVILKVAKKGIICCGGMMLIFIFGATSRADNADQFVIARHDTANLAKATSDNTHMAFSSSSLGIIVADLYEDWSSDQDAGFADVVYFRSTVPGDPDRLYVSAGYSTVVPNRLREFDPNSGFINYTNSIGTTNEYIQGLYVEPGSTTLYGVTSSSLTVSAAGRIIKNDDISDVNSPFDVLYTRFGGRPRDIVIIPAQFGTLVDVPTLFWTEERYFPDGSVDLPNSGIYYARADGSGTPDFITQTAGLRYPRSITYNPIDQKIYYINSYDSETQEGQIFRFSPYAPVWIPELVALYDSTLYFPEAIAYQDPESSYDGTSTLVVTARNGKGTPEGAGLIAYYGANNDFGIKTTTNLNSISDPGGFGGIAGAYGFLGGGGSQDVQAVPELPAGIFNLLGLLAGILILILRSHLQVR